MDAAVEEVVRAELVRSGAEARRRVAIGLALVISVPLTILAALSAIMLGSTLGFPALLLAGFWSLFAGLGGTKVVVHGISHQRDCAKQLRELDERRQLPVARLLR
jgi:fatty acid desaturase